MVCLIHGGWRGYMAVGMVAFTFMVVQLSSTIWSEVEFVHPVSPGGSVKFVASGVNFSIFTNFLCFSPLTLLKGLASHCKAKTTFAFHFSIINA